MDTVRYCTPEWLESSAEAYRADRKFAQELAKLTTCICFRIKAKPAWGIKKDIIFCSSVDKGVLRKLAFLAEKEAKEEAEFILSATSKEWKKILRKESKFVTAFMLGRIKLEQGSKVGVLGIAPHADTFVDALTQTRIRFPDEMSPEALAGYWAYVAQFRSELGV